MELWIRSQDKELLVLAKGFELQNPSYNGGCQIFAVWQNNYQCVGNYKSEERALEVLDEIEKLIKPITIFQNCQVDKSTIEKIKETGYCVINNDASVEQFSFSQVFYQMPKE